MDRTQKLGPFIPVLLPVNPAPRHVPRQAPEENLVSVHSIEGRKGAYPIPNAAQATPNQPGIPERQRQRQRQRHKYGADIQQNGDNTHGANVLLGRGTQRLQNCSVTFGVTVPITNPGMNVHRTAPPVAKTPAGPGHRGPMTEEPPDEETRRASPQVGEDGPSKGGS
ncbi:hypothetical protein CLAIMM_06558 [Cladophialophora immunda]|nr:hypothetical protein CLAIMM_06558 [Cladophialophora immunda]